jgi:uncharacterized membrane protein
MNQKLGVVLRKWFLAGLLVWIPLGVTLLVISSLLSVLDASLLLIPAFLRPDFPGVGVLLSIALVLGTGALTANFFGRQLLAWAEALFRRIPLVRSIYGGMKKLAEQVFSSKGTSFRKVVMVEYPRKGMWSLGFLTSDPAGEIEEKAGNVDLVAVFVPTTPNPTSGFLLLVPKSEVHELTMSVQEGMQFIISLGVVGPSADERKIEEPLP